MRWRVTLEFSVTLEVEGEDFPSVTNAATDLVEDALGTKVERTRITRIEKEATDVQHG